MSAARWGRLAADLEAAGVSGVRVDERAYTDIVRGRAQHGVSRSVRLILADGRHVVVRDGWWRKNPEVWIGWFVDLEDAEGIGVRTWPASKKRGEVVAAVLEAVAYCEAAVRRL